MHHLQATEELLDSYRLVDIEGEPAKINQLAKANNFYCLETDQQRARYVTHVDALYSFEQSTTDIAEYPNITVAPAELKQIFRYLKKTSEVGALR